MMRALYLILCALGATLAARGEATAPPFQDGDRVCYIGDSVTRGGGYHSLLQLFYATRFPQRHVAGFNAGHSGGAAHDCLRRLSWDVLDHQPTVALVMFGMNDMSGTYGEAATPRAEVIRKIDERIAKVQVPYECLLDQLTAAKVRLILVGPSSYDDTAKLERAVERSNLAMTRWTARVREIAARRQAGFVDLGAVMNPLTAKLQATDPSATLIGPDRIHPGPGGHLVMAYAILKAQGLDGRVAEIAVNAATGQAGQLFNCSISGVERQDHGIAFTCQENALPFVAPPGTEAGLQLVPFNPQLNLEMLRVENLPSGRYDLRIDDTVVGRYSASELTLGVNLAGNLPTPQRQQAREVMQANEVRHAEESTNQRLQAFLRHALLEPAKVDVSNEEAVEACLRAAVVRLPAGDFSRAMAENYLTSSKTKWDESLKTHAAALAQIARTRIPKPHRFQLTWLDEAARRRQAFAERASAPVVERLARELLAQLDLNRPELVEAKRLLDAAKPTDALSACRAVFMAALAGIDWPVAGPAKAVAAEPAAATRAADDLLANRYTTKNGEKRELGEPGVIDWNAQATSADLEGRATSQIEFYNPLLAAYVATGRDDYLRKWATLAEDWSLNETDFAEAVHNRLGDEEAHLAGSLLALLEQLSAVAKRAPSAGLLSDAVLARVLLKYIREYPAATAEYGRYNPQNWTPHMAVPLLRAGVVLDALGFSQGAFHLRRAKRLLESLATTWQMPDGSDSEQNFNYLGNFASAIQESLEFLKQHRPDLVTPAWEAEMTDAMTRRIGIMARIWQRSPGPTHPAGNRYGLWASALQNNVLKFQALTPGDHAGAAIREVLQGKANAKGPAFSSSWFPYGGYSFIRSGWEKTDQTGYFFCSPEPGNSAWRADQGNNLFVLAGFGRELLIGGERCTYDCVPSPVKIDGQSQHFHWGVPEFNHRHRMRANWSTPPPMRWLDAPDFNFTEGVYAGPYGGDARPLLGMRHHRQALLVRPLGLWIVTDRISGNTAPNRTYEQDWYLPVKPVETHPSYLAFDNDRIVMDNHARSVKTQDPGAANLSLYQFSPAAITYSKSLAKWGDSMLKFMKSVGAPRISERLCVAAQFAGQGDQAVVTALYPRAHQETDLAAVKALPPADGITGFEAATPGGGTVRYLAAVSGKKPLSLGPLTVTGESLLLASNNGQDFGLALGVERLAIHGTEGPPDCPDFAFRIEGGALTHITPIFTPLPEVAVLPASNVFIGRMTATLATVPDAEIRYTTDGSEPTAGSALYSQPLALTATTVLVARAYRHGFAGRAAEDPTFTGPALRAVFTREEPRPAETAVKPTGHHLGCDYYQGRWQDLYQALGTLQPAKSLPAAALFEQSMRATAGACAFRYHGYLEVPEDGVYSFHAPAEQVWQHQISGYDLRLFVAGEEWYPATRRHAFGSWSIALRKGLHRIAIEYVDHRTPAMLALNKPEWQQFLVWPGTTPNLRISGPGLPAPQLLTTQSAWLCH